ncbi:EAL domain-containing protein [Mycoplasmatota bacterium]|nr:EAL domain-containing protein [Mycoplasmatota bacterium]
MGYWLIERIFQDYLSIKEKINSGFRISINISPLQFKDKELLPKFNEIARKYNINFRNFESEITESIFMNDIGLLMKN